MIYKLLLTQLMICAGFVAVTSRNTHAASDAAFRFGNFLTSGSSSTFIRVAAPISATNLGNANVVQVAGGNYASLVRTDDGRVFGFGDNRNGQLGLGTIGDVVGTATQIDTVNLGGLKISQVTADSQFSLVLAEDGRAFSFGSNGSGRTGLGTASGNTLVATPIDATNLAGRRLVQVDAGDNYSLTLADDGTVFSFGLNTNGRTGLGTSSGATLIATPINTSGLGGRKITQVSAGSSHSLLLAEDGSVFSFGSNQAGKTGLGTASGETLIPALVDTSSLGGLKVTQVAADGGHSLLLAENGRVYAFGSNAGGNTGLGTGTGETLVPTPIDTSNLGQLKIAQIATGPNHSLLLAEDGRVFSFGTGSYGALGDGTSTSKSIAAPIDRTNLIGWLTTSISAGPYHSLIAAAPRLPGDYNNNGAVDAADYVLWRKTNGQLVPPGLGADGNGNGEITQLDYSLWRQSFGNSVGSGASLTDFPRVAVPEPSALLLVFASAILNPYRKRR